MITDVYVDKFGTITPEIGAIPYPIREGSIIDKYYSDVPEPWFADAFDWLLYIFKDNE